VLRPAALWNHMKDGEGEREHELEDQEVLRRLFGY
jgi:hypothetical protein